MSLLRIPGWPLASLGAALLALGLAGCSCSSSVEDKGAASCETSAECGEFICDLERKICVDPNDPNACVPEVNLCGCDDGKDPLCESAGRGPGDRPFDLDEDEASGVGLDDDGALILDSEQIDTHVIWIANTDQGAVSKVDTRSFVEMGRYQTTPLGLSASADPSRTTVNLFSDVYVGNRAHRSVTKISVLGDRCPDRNGDGVITTSTGPADIKPWAGEVPGDECILWYTKLPDDSGIVRAMAAQEVQGPDGALESVVWVGGWNDWIYKLDGDTGAILFRTPSPVSPYGFALDAAGNLWISTLSDPELGRIDTTRCLDEASCNVEVCDSGDGAAGDDCVKQKITRDDAGEGFYGITVDRHQQVWLGGGKPTRYDPSAAWGSRWTTLVVDGSSSTYAMGVGATREFAFLALNTGKIAQVPLGDPTAGVSLAGTSAYGIAIDLDGKVWGVPRASTVTVLTPSATLGDVAVAPDPPTGFVSPYTYSDMTGSQVRLASSPRGYYRTVFEGCVGAGASTLWGDLAFSAETPAGTSVVFRARSAATPTDLAAASWVTVAVVPGDASPASLSAAFSAASVTPGALLELEVQLITERAEGADVVSPRVSSVAVTHTCGGGTVI